MQRLLGTGVAVLVGLKNSQGFSVCIICKYIMYFLVSEHKMKIHNILFNSITLYLYSAKTIKLSQGSCKIVSRRLINLYNGVYDGSGLHLLCIILYVFSGVDGTPDHARNYHSNNIQDPAHTHTHTHRSTGRLPREQLCGLCL